MTHAFVWYHPPPVHFHVDVQLSDRAVTAVAGCMAVSTPVLAYDVRPVGFRPALVASCMCPHELPCTCMR